MSPAPTMTAASVATDGGEATGPRDGMGSLRETSRASRPTRTASTTRTPTARIAWRRSAVIRADRERPRPKGIRRAPPGAPTSGEPQERSPLDRGTADAEDGVL